MRILATLLGVVLGAGLLFAATPAMAGVDSQADRTSDTAGVDEIAPAAPMPGTDAEAIAYEQRQAAAPAEVKEYAGGTVVIGVSVFAVVLIVLLVILLSE